MNNLSVEFATAREGASLSVIETLNLTIAAGESVSIVGPSGCGKTTLLRTIGGLLGSSGIGDNALVRGRVLVNGLAPSKARELRAFGFAFQNPVLLPWRSLSANVRLPLELGGEIDQSARTAEMLRLVGVDDFANVLPATLSGGMQQRANIARALVHRPRVLLLDEPFGSLDEVTRERLNHELIRLHRLTFPTVMHVTHSLREACFLGDRVLVLSSRPARIIADIKSNLGRDRSQNFDTDANFVQLLAEVREVFWREHSVKGTEA